MNARDLGLLLQYNQWANLRLTRYAARLTARQLSAPSLLSHGSVLSTLFHVADAEWSWRLACQDGSFPRDYLHEKISMNLPALRSFWHEEMEDWLSWVGTLTDRKVRRAVSYKWARARPRRRILWHIIVHVVNHGTHHRSEVGHVLTAFGHSPGNTDFSVFVSRSVGQ